MYMTWTCLQEGACSPRQDSSWQRRAGLPDAFAWRVTTAPLPSDHLAHSLPHVDKALHGLGQLQQQKRQGCRNAGGRACSNPAAASMGHTDASRQKRI